VKYFLRVLQYFFIYLVNREIKVQPVMMVKMAHQDLLDHLVLLDPSVHLDLEVLMVTMEWTDSLEDQVELEKKDNRCIL